MLSRSLRAVAAAAVTAFVLAGCGGDSTPPRVATSILLAPGTVTMDAIGATQVVTAVVRDQDQQPITGAAVNWSASGSVTVSGSGASGTITAIGSGSGTVTVTSGAATAALGINVVQAAAAVEKLGGDQQVGPAGGRLPQPLQVRARDRLGNPVRGGTLAFVVTQGGGVTVPGARVTDNDGIASVEWTLGSTLGATHEVAVSTPGAQPAATFTATATAGAPAVITVLAGNNQGAPAGAAVPVAPSVQVGDAYGNPVPGATVTFAVTAGGGTVTGATQLTNAQGIATVGGWTLGTSAITNTLRATAGTVGVTFTATGTGATGGLAVSALTVTAQQAAMAGTAVANAPAVQVRNLEGTPVAGQTVRFQVATGGGSVTGATVVTDANGVAQMGSWVLGPVANHNTLTATVDAPVVEGNPVTFDGAGCQGGGGTGWAITLCFRTTMTASQRAVFETAAARWSQVITGDLLDLTPTIVCSGQPRVGFPIDDLLIFAAVQPIDGVGGVLGSAGWCLRRSGGLPLQGSMRFDEADLASMESGGSLLPVILHEMGHVIGMGTMWTQTGLLVDPSPVGGPATDAYFNGAGAIAAFDVVGGATYTGRKVPVENAFGSGTINSHWRESVLRNELMTGFINAGSNPLSLITVRSLADIGYTVNLAAADGYSFSPTALLSPIPGKTWYLHNDIDDQPQWEIDALGRVRRIR
jgi:hypothetical protein